MKNLTVRINRLNYKAKENNGGYVLLTPVYSTEEISDINEVNFVQIGGFESLEQAEEFAARFPKYTKMRAYWLHSFNSSKEPVVSSEFNTFWTNQVTGGKNEAAIKRRNRVIGTLKQMNL